MLQKLIIKKKIAICVFVVLAGIAIVAHGEDLPPLEQTPYAGTPGEVQTRWPQLPRPRNPFRRIPEIPYQVADLTDTVAGLEQTIVVLNRTIERQDQTINDLMGHLRQFPGFEEIMNQREQADILFRENTTLEQEVVSLRRENESLNNQVRVLLQDHHQGEHRMRTTFATGILVGLLVGGIVFVIARKSRKKDDSHFRIKEK